MNRARWPFCRALSSRPVAQARLAHAGGADEDDVGGGGDEVELGQAHDLPFVDAGLGLEGKRLQRPALGEPRLADAPLQGGFLAVVPLGAGQPQEQIGVGQAVLLGALQFLRQALVHPAQVQVLQELLELVQGSAHRRALPGPGRA